MNNFLVRLYKKKEKRRLYIYNYYYRKGLGSRSELLI